jgi:hypothetical protein
VWNDDLDDIRYDPIDELRVVRENAVNSVAFYGLATLSVVGIIGTIIFLALIYG